MSYYSIMRINEISDGWDTCHELEKPSDMCRYCSIERSEQIMWEPSGRVPQIRDWVIEDKDVHIKRLKENAILYIEHKIHGKIDEYKIAIWGLGNAFDNYYLKIKEYIQINYLIDIDENVLGSMCRKTGIEPLRICDIYNSDKLVIIICADQPEAILDISKYLYSGFEGVFFHANEFLKLTTQKAAAFGHA